LNVPLSFCSVNDNTVPYLTAAIETHDPFLFRETSGLNVFVFLLLAPQSIFNVALPIISVLDDKYDPLMKSYTIPASPPVEPPPPSKFSAEYWRSFKPPRLLLPPRLQLKFPFNLVCLLSLSSPPYLTAFSFSFPNQLIFASFPVIFPLIITVALTRLSLDSRASNARIKLLEQDTSKMEFIRTLFKGLEEDIDDAIAGYVDRVGPDALPAAAVAAAAAAGVRVVRVEDCSVDDGDSERESESDVEPREGLRSSEAHCHVHWRKSRARSKKGAKAKGQSLISGPGAGSGPLHPTYTHDYLPPSDSKCAPKLTDAQRRMAESLNALPQLKKKLVFIDGVLNSHAVIIARDMQRFKSHERGLGVVREWANSFVL
jgi:hypothetical protein